MKTTNMHLDSSIAVDQHPALLGSLVPPKGVKPLNFSPGYTSLAADVEAEIKSLFDAERMCSMYLSHRSPEFVDILHNTVKQFRIAMDIPDQYEILYMHGGGHGQFAAVPLNLCPQGNEKATYIVNGTWSSEPHQRLPNTAMLSRHLLKIQTAHSLPTHLLKT